MTFLMSIVEVGCAANGGGAGAWLPLLGMNLFRVFLEHSADSDFLPKQGEGRPDHPEPDEKCAAGSAHEPT